MGFDDENILAAKIEFTIKAKKRKETKSKEVRSKIKADKKKKAKQ